MSYNYDDIIKDSESIVREKSLPVELPLNTDNRTLLSDMLNYVRDSQDDELAQERNLRPAVGIAAIQLGIPKKMIAVVVQDSEGNNTEYALVNPKIISESVQKAYLKNGEGCLSVENEYEGLVPRSARVSVKGYDMLQDKDIVIKADDYLSIVLQHEIDHFAGILFYDRINKSDPWLADPEAIIIE